MTDKRTFKEVKSEENDSQEILDIKESDTPEEDNAENDLESFFKSIGYASYQTTTTRNGEVIGTLTHK